MPRVASIAIMKMVLWRRLLKRPAKFQLLFSVISLGFVIFACKQVLEEQEVVSRQQRRRRPSPAGPHDQSSSFEDLVYFRRDVPLIWIGGVPRSGTTLMRVMLDAHPDIRCGAETRVIPRILNMYQNMERMEFEMSWLREANLTEETLDNALGAYILSIIAGHGDPAPRLCNKDPFTMRSILKLVQIFPNSRFLLMVRDGRATVHSIISRNVTIKGFDFKSYRGAMTDWNRVISTMYSQCLIVGGNCCLPIYYERLILHPEKELRRILEFLKVSWNDVVLRYETTIGKKGGATLSKREYSFNQVTRPLSRDSLTKWVDHFPTDLRQEMRSIAPMLQMLGYDPDSYPPDYTLQNSAHLQRHFASAAAAAAAASVT